MCCWDVGLHNGKHAIAAPFAIAAPCARARAAGGRTGTLLSKKFSTWYFCKTILIVFWNSPCRETPKNVLETGKKNQEKKVKEKNEQIFCYAVLRLQQTAEGKKPLTRRTLALYTETRECAFTRCSGGHRFVLDTDTLADLTFRCEGYSDSLLGEAR
jgi:hypothetical protein